MDNLWGFKPEASSITTPKQIIDEQAELLSQMTMEKVSAKIVELEKNPLFINTSSSDFSFSYNFVIEAKYLPNYKLKLFNIRFNIPVYPVYVQVDGELKKEIEQEYAHSYFKEGYREESEQEFLDVLKLILGSKYVCDVVNTLLKMSDDKLPF